MTFEHSLILLAAAPTLALVLTWLGQVWFMAELRRLEPDSWRSLASPAWLRPLSLDVLRFIQTRSYRSLRSSKLRTIASYLRLAQLLILAMLAALLAYSLSSLWSRMLRSPANSYALPPNPSLQRTAPGRSPGYRR